MSQKLAHESLSALPGPARLRAHISDQEDGKVRRNAVFGSCLMLLLVVAGCDQRVTEPAPEAASPALSAIAGTDGISAAGIDRPSSLALTDGRIADGRLIDLAFDPTEAINPDDYMCPASTPIFDIYSNAFFEFLFGETDIFFFLYVDVWADLLPQYEALIFLESDRKQEYGYDGEFTNAINRTNTDLRRFSDIPSDELHVVPMKGSMLYDTERVARAYMSPLVPPFGGLPEADAYLVAGLIQQALDASELLDGGNHPLFSFNAFAFSGAAGLGIPPKIIMGDAILNGYADLGFGDVAPQAILAHEWAHHIQYAYGWFNDPVPSLDPPADAAEATRYSELMADAWAAYYLTHKRGGTMNAKRVVQFLEVFYQIGDCAFSDPSHHGTPNQRMKAAEFGFDLADQAQKQGHIMSSEEFHEVFVANYLSFIQPDA